MEYREHQNSSISAKRCSIQRKNYIALLQETLHVTNIKFNGFQQYDLFHISGTNRGLKSLVKNPASLGIEIETLAVTIHLSQKAVDLYNIYCPPRPDN